MTSKTRTRITVRTEKTTVVIPWRVRCRQCGTEVPITTCENAAAALQTTPDQIHRLLETGNLHEVEQPQSEGLICGDSVSATANEI